jgi:hypothetical protein
MVSDKVDFLAGNLYGRDELARVLVRLDHVASFIVNANHASSGRLKNLAKPIALLIAFGPAY